MRPSALMESSSQDAVTPIPTGTEVGTGLRPLYGLERAITARCLTPMRREPGTYPTIDLARAMTSFAIELAHAEEKGVARFTNVSATSARPWT